RAELDRAGGNRFVVGRVSDQDEVVLAHRPEDGGDFGAQFAGHVGGGGGAFGGVLDVADALVGEPQQHDVVSHDGLLSVGNAGIVAKEDCNGKGGRGMHPA